MLKAAVNLGAAVMNKGFCSYCSAGAGQKLSIPAKLGVAGSGNEAQFIFRR